MIRLVVVLAVLATVGCGSSQRNDGAAKSPAAKVEPHAGGEAGLTRVVLAPDAERRLGITLAPLERRRVPQTRTTGGDVVVPARLAGVQSPPLVFGGSPAAADRLHAADALVAADEAAARARIDVEAAASTLARAERVLRAEATSVRTVEEARARLLAAQAVSGAAEMRRKMLAEATFGGDTLWVRVPLYAGDVPLVAEEKPALVSRLGQEPGRSGRPARPVAGPRAGNPDAATVDVFYVIEDREAQLRPGERVAVTLELRGDEEALVTPWSAIVYDVHGGEWLYEQVAPHEFARRRVQVHRVTGPDAVLADGPRPGALIVVAGAAELFGIEFGAGK